MRLLVAREPTIEGVTLGSVYIDGTRFCDSLEDPIREQKGIPVEQWKVQHETAIPAGIYPLRLSFSQRFQRVLPEVVNVPGFSGIRIHAGNTVQDTSGCLLVGSARNGRALKGSRVALEKLLLEFQAKVNELHTIEYRNPEKL